MPKMISAGKWYAIVYKTFNTSGLSDRGIGQNNYDVIELQHRLWPFCPSGHIKFLFLWRDPVQVWFQTTNEFVNCDFCRIY